MEVKHGWQKETIIKQSMLWPAKHGPTSRAIRHWRRENRSQQGEKAKGLRQNWPIAAAQTALKCGEPPPTVPTAHPRMQKMRLRSPIAKGRSKRRKMGAENMAMAIGGGGSYLLGGKSLLSATLHLAEYKSC
jgi:hypothetical protein